MGSLLRNNSKAIAAAVGSLAAFLAMKVGGFDVGPDFEMAVVTVVAAVITWFAPANTSD